MNFNSLMELQTAKVLTHAAIQYGHLENGQINTGRCYWQILWAWIH